MLLFVLLACVTAGPAQAHERSESFSHWRYGAGALDGIVTVRAREVTRLMLPGEGYGSLAEVFAAHVQNTIAAAVDGKPCVPARAVRSLEAQPGFVRVAVGMRCAPGVSLAISVATFFAVAPSHHHFIYVETAAGGSREAILSASSHELQLNLTSPRTTDGRFLQFVQMGILHIATGIDHLAFLLALLITARTARQVLLTVTGFTLGHSLTLTLAVSGTVAADRGAVEALIGLTIALAAAGNLIQGEREGRAAAAGAALLCGSLLLVPPTFRPDMPGALVASIALAATCLLWLRSDSGERGGAGVQTRDGARATGTWSGARFAMALGFGLIHGLGFASALDDLHLPRALLVSSLAGFNIGVEIGQLAAVASAVVLFRVAGRLWPPLERSAVPAVVVSSALLAVGSAWFLTRSVAFGN